MLRSVGNEKYHKKELLYDVCQFMILNMGTEALFFLCILLTPIATLPVLLIPKY